MKAIESTVNILLVEGDDSNRALVKEALAQIGNPTLVETNDLTTLQQSGVPRSVDLILTGAPPGKKKSLRLYEQISQRWPDSPLLVIVGDVKPGEEANALAHGVREILPPTGDVPARLALHLEAERLRRKQHSGDAGATRSIAFQRAMGKTLTAMQQAPDFNAVFDLLSEMLNTFNLDCTIVKIHPNQTYTVKHTSFSSKLLNTFERISGVDFLGNVGSMQRVTFMREVMAHRRAIFVDDAVIALAEALGFAGVRPIAVRVLTAVDVKEFIAAPLIAGDEIWGLVLVTGSDRLTPADLPSINLLATQLSACLQIFAGQEGEVSQANHLRLVAQIGRETAAFPDLHSLLHRVLRRIHAALPGEYATIALVEGNYAICEIESFKTETYRPPSTRGVQPLRVGHEGIIGHVAASGEPLLAADVRQEPRYRPDPERPDVRSELAVPLRFREEIVGVLDVESGQLAAFDQEHIDLLEAVAGQLAAIIVTTRTRLGVEDAARQLSALAATSEALSVSLPLQERLSRIAESACRGLAADGVALHLLNKDGASLIESVALDDSDLTAAATRLAEKVAFGGQAADLSPDDEAGRDGFMSSAPLPSERHTCGAITLLRRGDRPFTADDRERLATFANQAAVAVSLTRLVEQTKRQSQLLDMINFVSRVVGSSLDLNEVLDAILKALRELIDYSSASIMLFEAGSPIIAGSSNMPEDELVVHDEVAWTDLPIMRQLMAQHRPFVIPDTTQEQRWHAIPAFSYVKSWIGIPLLSRGNMIGILNVNSDRPGRYQDADGNHVMAFANQIATALDNALLFGQFEERQLEARALYEVTRAMVSSHDQDEIIERVLANIGRVISFDIGVVLRASERTAGEPFYVKSYTPQSINETLVSLAQRRIAENYEVLSNNLISRRGVQPDLRNGVATTTRDERLPSLLSVPLLLGDRLLGMLELNNTVPDAYDESDLRVLFTVANSLATALENATLMGALRARARELEKADYLRGNIVQNISHELRNPLTFLTGYIGLMQGGELGPLTEEQEHGLEVIAAKVDTLINLVDDFVTLNNISPETLQRTLQDVNLLIEEAIEGVEGSASERGLKVLVQTPAEPQFAQVDPRRFNQAIDNLLSNALKFSNEGGEIVARVIDLDEWVRVEVEDHGVGISPEVQARIFDRFYQADRDTARKMKGMGLGMAISKEIVEAHGGLIGVESVPGEGSTFYIELAKYLPKGDSPASRPPASAA